MTRENKLALVIGFGLMLFVGILVSDHFSAQRFNPVDVAKASNGVEPPSKIEIEPVGTSGQSGTQSTGGTQIATGGGTGAGATVDGPIKIEDAPPTTPPGDGVPVRFHKVDKGDTYWSIAAKEYGDGALAAKHQEYKKDAAPDAARLTLGAELRIPPVEVLRPGALAKADGTAKIDPTKPDQTVASKVTTYTIKQGDTPYAIARSKGIKVADLLSANGIKDPSALKPGQTLKIPSKF